MSTSVHQNFARRLARLTLPIAMTALLAVPAMAQDTITISSWGGNYQEAMSKAIWQPTAKELGITILEDSTNGLADVRAQVTANSVLWDITELTIDGCAQGQTEGLFENLDYTIINKDGFDPAIVQPTYIGFNYYSNVIGWSTEKFGDAGPQSWADFWNVEKFPGRRSLRNDPAEVLEAALLADGVAPDKLYPLDLDRAFASLEKIKPHISVWWSSGAQAAQLVADGEVDMIGAWNGRISAAIAAGAKYKFTFNQGLLIADCLAIPKGVKNKDLAMKALAKAVSPEILANIPQYIDYGPANLKSYETGKIPPELAKTLNTSPENAAKQAIVRGDWWGEHGAATRDRWAKFINQ